MNTIVEVCIAGFGFLLLIGLIYMLTIFDNIEKPKKKSTTISKQERNQK